VSNFLVVIHRGGEEKEGKGERGEEREGERREVEGREGGRLRHGFWGMDAPTEIDRHRDRKRDDRTDDERTHNLLREVMIVSLDFRHYM